MVKLPISDYVNNFYKEQGIEFTYRQQARLCWTGYSLLKEKINSLKEILEISDDEQLNQEMMERIVFEEKAYERFLVNNESGVIYTVKSKIKEDYDEYFASAKAAISYGIRNFEKGFRIDKCFLLDKYPEELTEGKVIEEVNPIQASYVYTSQGEPEYGWSYECEAGFEEDDSNRFENMFLNIKSPFGLGDIVMGPDWEYPQVVSTDYDAFYEVYEICERSTVFIIPEAADNCIRTDEVRPDGEFDYSHTYPFDLWKIDSWEDEKYWKILQVLSKAIKAGINLCDLSYMIYEYKKEH
ncbi:MAG: hypothetical protein IJN54_13630 [Lachnospiraceae bacterium]|nr:hypothetical protein [Lachnospiraceae bacterium]